MTCYHPISAYKLLSEKTNSGKSVIVFQKPGMDSYFLDMQLPCGQCAGCRLEKSRQWAIRCMCEAKLHDLNSFITLTYNNQHLPSDGSLDMKHFQDFMKRLRIKFQRGFWWKDKMENEHWIQQDTIRFYHCGEYGDTTRRPHYHAIIFGVDFPDKVLYKTKGSGSSVTKLYTSEILQEIWGKGFATVGSVTFDSAGYCARYVMKKRTGKSAAQYYETVDERTAEIIHLKPEYSTMSRRPGIAAAYLTDDILRDIYKDDTIVVKERAVRPPKFFDTFYEHLDKDHFGVIKAKRVVEARKHADNCTPERLRTRELVKLSAIKNLTRSL